jgi:5'(3')-deoxyribonucleotidase
LPKFQVFLDLDDVLADFKGAACKVYGTTLEEYMSKNAGREWDMCPTLGVSRADFWNTINAAGAIFWENIEPLPWFDSLVSIVANYDSDWVLLSAPSLCSSSYVGKIAWIKKHLGDKFERYILTSHKELLAKPGTLLIDDRERNVERFVKAGGDGIVFPSEFNCFYQFAKEPVSYLEGLLNETAAFNGANLPGLRVSRQRPLPPR